jgi:hypothetical protein
VELGDADGWGISRLGRDRRWRRRDPPCRFAGLQATPW